ncbi:MAG: pyridoxal-phosphate dependent enzyme, partial [Actinomycetales bacterium]
MSLLARRFPDADLPHVSLGTGPTPVHRLDVPGLATEVWVKDESGFGDGGWGGNKVRKLEWIIPEAHRRRRRTLFTVGGIGTHWGLAAALYGSEHGLRTVLGLVDQPVDDHVRDQTRRLEASDAVVHRFGSVGRLKLAAPFLLARYSSRGRLPYYLPAGGSSPVGTLGYVETALEIAQQVADGALPEPGVVVTAVGSGGTAAGLALGLRMMGLRTRVMGVVVNDSFPLDRFVVAGLARRTAELLRSRGVDLGAFEIGPNDLDADDRWLGETYGASTPEGLEAQALGEALGLHLEPVYT